MSRLQNIAKWKASWELCYKKVDLVTDEWINIVFIRKKYYKMRNVGIVLATTS